MADIVEYERWQRRALVAYTVSFALWGASLTAFMAVLSGDIQEPVGGITGAITAVTGLIWAYYMLRYFIGMGRYGRAPHVRRASRDERVKSISAKALSASFWGLMISAGGIVLAGVIFEIELSPIALATGAIWVGVTIALTASLIFEWRDET